MSYISFRRELFQAFLHGGAAAVIIFTTSYVIDKIHQHCDDMKELFERVEKCEEIQDHYLKK